MILTIYINYVAFKYLYNYFVQLDFGVLRRRLYCTLSISASLNLQYITTSKAQGI